MRMLGWMSTTLLLLVSAVCAEPLETTVKYVSATGIYLDAGRTLGIQKGDQGEVFRGDSVIARVEVEFLADNSASCKMIETTSEVRVGDRVVMQITPPVQSVKPDTVQEAPAPAIPPSPTPKKSAKTKVNRVTGRASVQALSQDDRSVLNSDYVEPAFALRLQVNNLFDTQHYFSVRLRSRQTNRSHGSDSRWTNRYYEFALYYNDPATSFHYGAGRLLFNRMSGIGYMDGAIFDYKVSEYWAAGAFGGAQPDLTTYQSNSDATKAGLFAAYERGSYSTSRLSGTLALAGNYFTGQISREFFYEQLSYSAQKFYFYQSSEVNVNRGWRKDAEGSSLDLSNILMNARYQPLSWLTTTLSYDNRTNYRTYETRNTPDSLFDDALRQGWRLGTNVKVASQVYALAEGGIRTKQDEGTETRSGTAGLGSHNLVKSGVQVDARVNVFRNEFSRGTQPTLTLSRNLIPQVRLGLQLGQNDYTIEQTDESVTNQWARLNADWNLTRHVYGSLYGEVYRGDGLDANRMFGEVGYRF